MAQPIAGQVLSNPHLTAHKNQWDANAYFGFDAAASDNSAAAASLIAALPSTGVEVLIAPGQYKFLSQVNWYDVPSMKFRALGGRHFQGIGTTANPVQTGGVIFEGWTAGMTLFKVDRPGSNTDPTHQGPTFEGIGFQDGRAVASRRGIVALAVSSGTKYVYTTSSAHTFAAGDVVFINNVNYDTAPFGSLFSGRFTVLGGADAPTSTTFKIDIGSNPSLTGIDFSDSTHQAFNAQVRYIPSMTLVDCEHETRSRFRDCNFTSGLYGLKYAGTNDNSWANLTGNTFCLNDYGMYFAGDAAQSCTIQGGDFQLGSGQIGIDYVGSKAMFKARDFKMDTVFNDGTGVIGVRLESATQYQLDGSFEMDGYAVNVSVGDAGGATGRISGSFQGNNRGAKGSRVGVAIELGVTDTSAVGATTNASTNISLASYDVRNRHSYFDQADVGKTITGTNIPASSTIRTVVDATHATLGDTATPPNSVNATGTGSGITFTWSWGGGSTTNNPDTTSEMTLSGSTFTSQGIAVRVGASCRGVTIMGGTATFCDIGAQIDAGAVATTLAFFKRHRAESGGSDATFAANHIVDNGTGTQRIFCDNITNPGGVVPAAGSTTMTSGFVHISSGAGPPTGVPTIVYPGLVPLYFDTTGLKMYAYAGGTWKTQAGAYA